MLPSICVFASDVNFQMFESIFCSNVHNYLYAYLHVIDPVFVSCLYAYLQMIESILCFQFVSCLQMIESILYVLVICILANDWIQFILLTKWSPIHSINWWCLKQAFWKIVHSQDAYLQMIESILYAVTTFFLVPIWIFSTIAPVLF